MLKSDARKNQEGQLCGSSLALQHITITSRVVPTRIDTGAVPTRIDTGVVTTRIDTGVTGVVPNRIDTEVVPTRIDTPQSIVLSQPNKLVSISP